VNENVVAWLRSPEGEEWSRKRLREARGLRSDHIMLSGRKEVAYVLGFFSIKYDDSPCEIVLQQ
jgi:hypothetical protein